MNKWARDIVQWGSTAWDVQGLRSNPQCILNGFYGIMVWRGNATPKGSCSKVWFLMQAHSGLGFGEEIGS